VTHRWFKIGALSFIPKTNEIRARTLKTTLRDIRQARDRKQRNKTQQQRVRSDGSEETTGGRMRTQRKDKR